MGKFVDRPRYGCALAGALGVLRAIPRAVPIVHASAGCGYNIYVGMNVGSGYLGGGYCGATSIPSSNIIEKDIVFGGEERLREQIKTTMEVMDGELYVVVTGCMVEMIGDDVEAVVQEFADSSSPVMAVSTPSFKGNAYYGYDITLEALVKEYVAPSKTKKDKKVNILGIVPGEDVFWKGNLKEIKRVLSLIGVKANTLFGEGETLADIKNSGDASLNIVLSDVYGSLTAQAYKEFHGISSIYTGFPVGYLQTAAFLKQVADFFQIDQETLEAALGSERHIYYDYLERAADIYNDIDLQRYAVVVADANYGPAVSRFVSDELGWIPQVTVITDVLTAKQQQRLAARFDNYESGLRPGLFFDTDTSAVKKYVTASFPEDTNKRYYDSGDGAVVIGSVFERDISDEWRYPLLTLSFPVTNRVVFNKGYAGFNGGLSLAEELFTLLIAGR